VVKEAQVKSAHRTLAVLELFRLRQKPMNVTEIGHELGYPLSSTSILLRMLAAEGYLIINRSDKSYFPTARVTALGTWIHEAPVLNPDIVAIARALYGELALTVTLSVAVGHQMEFVYMLASKKLRKNVNVGTQLPICESTVGYAWLITRSNFEVQRVVEWHNNIASKSHKIAPGQLLARIQEFKRRDYAASPSPLFPGSANIAIPIRDSAREQVMVFTVTGLPQEILPQQERMVSMIRKRLSPYIVPY
jgi:DNA-binding IclR family transcriptional regulator